MSYYDKQTRRRAGNAHKLRIRLSSGLTSPDGKVLRGLGFFLLSHSSFALEKNHVSRGYILRLTTALSRTPTEMSKALATNKREGPPVSGG